MKTFMTYAIMLLFCSLTLSGQNKQAPISMVFKGSGYRFVQNNVTLNRRQVLDLLHTNPIAYDRFKSAKTLSSLGGILLFGGSLVAAIGLANDDLITAAAGTGVMIVAIPLHFGSIKRTRSAIDNYNRGLLKPSPGFSLNISSDKEGIGIKVLF